MNATVSNWFINARVRLWKPMVEEMYQQEAKEKEEEEEEEEERRQETKKNTTRSNNNENIITAVHTTAQNPTPSTTTITTATTATAAATGHHQRSQINAHDSDLSFPSPSATVDPTEQSASAATCQHLTAVAVGFGTGGADISPNGGVMRFGTKPAGDVSLTLGLRHAGNMPDSNPSFSLRDFGGY